MISEVDVLIVGAGHAGAQVAIALRQQEFEGSIAIVGDEPELPYERPPLSKDYLSGAKPFERMLIRPPEFWGAQNVKLLAGQLVVKVDPGRHRVETPSGHAVTYGCMVWAAGGRPRALVCPGHDLRGVHTLRSRADVDRIIGELGSVRCVAIVGGGYIGLETAAVLRKMGKQVTVLEAQDRVLARVAGEPLSRFYEAEHRAQGVDIRVGVSVRCLEGAEGRLTGVRLSTGEWVPADLVIVGIGIVPAVEPLLDAGASGVGGVAVDASGRTSLPDVYAIGDCALDVQPFAEGRSLRLESVQNAHDMATRVAHAMVGQPLPARTVPWFWSSQYDLRLQTVGLSLGFDDIVLRGDPQARSFAAIYLKAGRVLALDCVNALPAFVQGKALVGCRAAVPRDALADTSVALKAWAVPSR